MRLGCMGLAARLVSTQVAACACKSKSAELQSSMPEPACACECKIGLLGDGLGAGITPGLCPVKQAESERRQHKADAWARQGRKQRVERAICMIGNTTCQAEVIKACYNKRDQSGGWSRQLCVWRGTNALQTGSQLNRLHTAVLHMLHHTSGVSQNGMAMARKNRKATASAHACVRSLIVIYWHLASTDIISETCTGSLFFLSMTIQQGSKA